uniref:Uncharacterized protein n=1 Tax=Picea glauca TaxID=3330 RepID=A0A124GNA3_PICGL|nr:hypothetical protein ABT39_MTgene5199 [Picea glauca]QHR91178.1 hypothetical protein Q903MT_gene5210 [Picea sitchensis]
MEASSFNDSMNGMIDEHEAKPSLKLCPALDILFLLIEERERVTRNSIGLRNLFLVSTLRVVRRPDL